jgi:hypothetical protein
MLHWMRATAVRAALRTVVFLTAFVLSAWVAHLLVR